MLFVLLTQDSAIFARIILCFTSPTQIRSTVYPRLILFHHSFHSLYFSSFRCLNLLDFLQDKQRQLFIASLRLRNIHSNRYFLCVFSFVQIKSSFYIATLVSRISAEHRKGGGEKKNNNQNNKATRARIRASLTK